MKISEITDRNLVWNELNSIDFDKISDTYKFIVKVIETIRPLNSPNFNRRVFNNIEVFDNLVNAFLQIDYPDKNDEDILNFRNEVTKMKNHIDDLSRHLKV